MAPELRPHQVAQREGLRRAFAAGHRRVIVQGPTGSGKGTLIADLGASAAAKGNETVVVSHLGEINRDLRDRLLAAGAPAVRFVMGDETDGPADAPVIVTSIQTVEARELAFPNAKLILPDEVHRAAAAGYQAFLGRHPQARIAGFTATPARSDGAPLEGFTSIVQGPQIRELLALDLLAPVTLVAPAEPARNLCQDPVAVYPAGRPGVVFGANVGHSAAIARGLCGRGMRAAHVDGESPDRVEVLERFAGGDLDVLCCYRLLVEGVDLPRAEVCVLASSVTSTVVYLQAIGRVRRPRPGKRALLLDLCGVWHLHGGPDEDRTYHLDGQGIRVQRPDGEVKLTQCRGCLAWGTPRTECEECGHVRPPPAPPKIRAKDLIEQRAGMADPSKQAVLRRLVEKAVSLGRSPWSAQHAFKGTFGHYPEKTWMREILAERESRGAA